MSSRPRVPVLAGAVCAAVLLAGCSSSGTVGSASANGAVAGGTGGTGSTSADGGADPGCNQAIAAIQNAERAQNSADPQTAIKGAETSIGQLRSAANAIQKPGGKDAINKVADDLQNIVTQSENGQNPDTSQALTDAQQVASICGM